MVKNEELSDTIYLGSRLRKNCGNCGKEVKWHLEDVEGFGEAMVAPCECGNKMLVGQINDPEFAKACRDLFSALKED
jgi:hypothetical protein